MIHSRKLRSAPVLVAWLLFAAAALADPVIQQSLVASGGGVCTGEGLRLRCSLGQPAVGRSVGDGGAPILDGGYGALLGDHTPVLLSLFAITPGAGRVGLVWEAAPDGGGAMEFLLLARLDDLEWSVPVAVDAPGRYSALDENAALADGGECVYELRGRLAGEDWLPLLRQTAVVEPIPLVTELRPPFPNPFNPQVTIPYSLARDGHLRLSVYDIRGRRLARLADGAAARGRHEITWRGRDDDGRDLPTGVYFLLLEAPEYSETRKLMLLR